MNNIAEQQQLIRKASPIYLAEQTALNPGLGLILADLTKRFAPETKACPRCQDAKIPVAESICDECWKEIEADGPEDSSRWVNTDAAGWMQE